MNGRKIRVLHVGLDTNLGGIETYLLKISNNIDKEEFEFSFLAYDDENPCFYNELTAMGWKFHFVRSRRTSFSGNRKDLRELYRREKFDIVHFCLNSLTYITPITEALKCGIKVVAQSHNAGSVIGSSSRVLCMLNKIIFPYSKVSLAAVSDKAGNWMFGKKRNVLILNNGIETSTYRFSQDERLSLRKKLGLDGKEVIIHVGAFRKQKNHEFLINIFKEYHTKNDNSVLLLVGDGELRENIEGYVAENNLSPSVMFLGKRSDIPSLLSASDKFLFPSLYEGFPNALIEAETAGLLCVVSDVITEEACLENSIRVSLNASSASWADALSRPCLSGRVRYADVVEKHGLGIRSEMQRLENLYRSLV